MALAPAPRDAQPTARASTRVLAENFMSVFLRLGLLVASPLREGARRRSRWRLLSHNPVGRRTMLGLSGSYGVLVDFARGFPAGEPPVRPRPRAPRGGGPPSA